MSGGVKEKWIPSEMSTDLERDNAINAEATARQNADTGLQNQITTNANAISAETTARENADTGLQNQITTNTNQISTNTNSISSEVTARQNADTGLQNQITSNANAISAEVTARQNADTGLQNQITANANSISAEVTARGNADTNLQNQITSIVNNFASNVMNTVLTGLSLAVATAIVAGDSVLVAFGKLQAQVSALFNLRSQIYDAERSTSLGTSSTSTWVTYLTLTSPALAQGDYRLDYQWTGAVSNNSRSIEFRIVRNGVTLYQSTKFVSSSSEPLGASRYIKFLQISGVQTISIDFRVGSGGNTTATLNDAQLTLERVGN